MEKWGRVLFAVICFTLAGVMFFTRAHESENSQIQASVAIEQAEEQMKQSFQEEKNSLVLISMGQATGSGVVYQMEGPGSYQDGVVIVTCAHVVAYWDEETTVRFYDTYEIEGTLIGSDEERDLAFIWVSNEALGRQRDGLQGAPRKDVSPYKEDMFLYTAGFSMEKGLTYYTGVLRQKGVQLPDFVPPVLLCTAKVDPGMSGGGVFAQDGTLIGLIEASADADMSAAIDVDTIEKAYIDICVKKGQNNKE